MKILLLTDGISPFVIGGMQKHSFLLTKYLAVSGVHVELHHCVYDQQDLPETAKVFTKKENQNINAVAHHFPRKGRLPGHYSRNSYKYSKILFNSVKERLNDFDFIYTKGFTGWRLFEEKQKGILMPRVGVKLHGMNMFMPTYGLKEKIEQYILKPPAKFIMNNADVVFSYGGKVTETIITAGIPKFKITEIPTGIEDDWIRDNITPTGQKKNFIFIGRYDLVKGIRELNQALKLLDGNFEFHFVGPFENHKKIIKPNIFYHGLIADAETMKNLLDKMDILVLPSYSEGMPNVILEAMARGLTVMATDVGAVGLLVNESCGFLLKSSSTNTIVKAILKINSLDSLYVDQLKNNALKRVAINFKWQFIAQKTIVELRE